MRRKKRLKRKLKNILLILLILMFLLFLFNMCTNIINKNKLKQKGYNISQINKINEFSFDIKTILKYDYCKEIDTILNKDYNKNNLEDFLKNCNIEVPNENSKPSEEPKSESELIEEKIKNEKYYIPDRLNRYLNYYKNHSDKSTKDIVTEVNCNIDYEFYTNTKSADLSKGILMLVNKYYYLDKTYTPDDPSILEKNKYSNWDDAILSKPAYDAYIKMLDDAKELGYNLIDTSPYRSYDYQSTLYYGYVEKNGLEWALRSSAKPGHSEHQTGLASDVVKKGSGLYDFENTKEFNWIKDNAHKYGFILRYPSGKEYLTGYKYEPWHYRYVGVDVANYIYENNIVFEEYYAYFCEYKNEC